LVLIKGERAEGIFIHIIVAINMSVQIAVSVMLKSATVLFFLIVFVAWSGAGAETLIPNSVEYTVEIKHEKSAASCTIMVTILNYPISPEALNFRAGVWQGKVQDDQFETLTGFTLDVGNLQFKNGLIIGTQKTPIADAAFGSKTFNSLGRLYEMESACGEPRRGAIPWTGSGAASFRRPSDRR
jgi:hypothetical protein